MSDRNASRSFLGPALMIGGGLATIGAIWLGMRKSTETTEAIQRAVRGEELPGALPQLGPKPLPQVQLHLTGYWPFRSGLTEAQRRMEGGVTDRKGKPLHTLEDHLADPIKHPYVSLSGDDAIFPYGQRLIIDAWPTAIFRVVDTGSHFRKAGKVYRAIGEEPIDVCVNSSSTVVPSSAGAQIVPGDNFAGGLPVATAKIKAQTVAGEVASASENNFFEARMVEDYEALARAIESELSGRDRQEQIAAAWAIRNRADDHGITIHEMLAPSGQYGAPSVSGGFASTRKVPTEASREIANEVLDAPEFADPTDKAIDFWLPSEQVRMRQIGDIYRAAVKSGDKVKADRYARYAQFGTEGDVRVQHARNGLRVVNVVGKIELLGRI
jgi:hypothetical protein